MLHQGEEHFLVGLVVGFLFDGGQALQDFLVEPDEFWLVAPSPVVLSDDVKGHVDGPGLGAALALVCRPAFPQSVDDVLEKVVAGVGFAALDFA